MSLQSKDELDWQNNSPFKNMIINNNIPSWWRYRGKDNFDNYVEPPCDTGIPIWRIPIEILPEEKCSYTTASLYMIPAEKGKWLKFSNQITFELEVPGCGIEDLSELSIEGNKLKIKTFNEKLNELIDIKYFDDINFNIKPWVTVKKGILTIDFHRHKELKIDLLNN